MKLGTVALSEKERMRARLGGRTCSIKMLFRRFPIEHVDRARARAGAKVQRGDKGIEKT